MAHPNEDLVRKGYAAFGSGDLDTLRGLFSDDIVWHTPGHSQLSGDVQGIDAVFEQFGKVFEMTGGTFSLELHDVIGGDDHVVALAHSTGEREGRRLDDNTVQVFHVRDGKVTESWLYPADLYKADEFWS